MKFSNKKEKRKKVDKKLFFSERPLVQCLGYNITDNINGGSRRFYGCIFKTRLNYGIIVYRA